MYLEYAFFKYPMGIKHIRVPIISTSTVYILNMIQIRSVII